jgi:N-acyl-D-amino-acid deacylase
MRKVAESAMEDGAFGVAYALIYPPDAYAQTDELVEICWAVRRYGGLYVTHMRPEGDRFPEAINEAVTIGREASIPVEIYHLKASGRRSVMTVIAVLGRPLVATHSSYRSGGRQACRADPESKCSR